MRETKFLKLQRELKWPSSDGHFYLEGEMRKQLVLGPLEIHPYGPYFPKKSHSMIIGTFPIAKFTSTSKNKSLKSTEIDFSYGGETNQLWHLLSLCFKRDLKSKKQIISFLEHEGIALGDVIKSCRRINGGSSDSNLRDCEYFTELRNLIIIHGISKIYFTSVKVQTIFHAKIGSIEGVEEILLISPSASGMRQISKFFQRDFGKWKRRHPLAKPSEFRIFMYKKTFTRELASHPERNHH